MFSRLKIKFKTLRYKTKIFWQGIPKTIFLQIVFFGFFFALEKIMGIQPINLSPKFIFWSVSILMISFFIVSFLAFRELSPKYVLKEKMKNRGVYAFLRHPFYGAIIFLLNPAIAILFKSWGLLVACFVSYFIWKAHTREEEGKLIKKFGKEYEAYQLKVPRMFFPLIFENAYSRKRAVFYILVALTSFFIVIISFNLYINFKSKTVSFNEYIGPQLSQPPIERRESFVLFPTPTTTPIPTPTPIPTLTSASNSGPIPTQNQPRQTQNIGEIFISIKNFWEQSKTTISFTVLIISFLGILLFGYILFIKKQPPKKTKKIAISFLAVFIVLFISSTGFYILSKIFFSESIFNAVPIPSNIKTPSIPIPLPTSITSIIPPNLFEMNSEGIYINLSGTISIPKIGIEAPIIFVGDPKWVDYDHKYGVVHYPGTAFPGTSGAGLFSGHSSAPRNLSSPYTKVFSQLDRLEANDEIIINFQGNIYNYRVFRKEIIAPREFRLREYQDKETITLLSCWPVGTDARRIIIEAERVN